MLDTKTTVGDSFPYSKIESHQVEEMVKHHHSGAKAGYVIWFRKTDDIFFMPAHGLADLLNKRGSIKGGDEISKHLGNSKNFKAQMIFGIN